MVIDFVSAFTVNHEFLAYEEVANVTLKFKEISSLTLFLVLNVDPKSNGLRVIA
jgi:hypothetical protein